MSYPELVELVPTEKRKDIVDKLVDIILSSKNANRLSSSVANTILYQWQLNLLTSELGLSALLEAAVLLEQEKTLSVLRELQLVEIADKVKGEV